MPENLDTDSLNIRESGVDYEMEFSLEAGELVEYSKDEDCGKAAHKTKHGKHFSHLHVNYTLPQTGTIVRKRETDTWVDVADGEEKEINSGNIEAYWKHEFDGYTEVSGINISQNCIAYARGYDCWIEPIPNTNSRGVIESDDYEDTEIYAAGNIERGSSHDIVIVEVYSGEGGKIKKTRETNGQGGIYEKTYDTPGRAVKAAYKMQKLKA